MKLKTGILSILFWSIISAAFIGPGTVTTATKAGADYHFQLLWAFSFSMLACILLQEASARISIVSGLTVGQAIARQFKGKMSVSFFVVGAILIGCSAYEAGNILGAVEGLVLIFDVKPENLVIFKRIVVILLALGCFFSLNVPTLRSLANYMGVIVILMGFAFIGTAIYLKPDWTSVLKGSVIPSMPNTPDAGLLVLGLVGTTVVPYDIFLGSGIADKKQSLSEMRLGISVSIIIGGLISGAILIVGTIVTGDYSFPALSKAIASRPGLGQWAVVAFGFGMFAAGFSSAITSPLASALTTRSLLEGKNKKKWDPRSIFFKMIWMTVLCTGLLFGFLQVKPVPAIILAQALNGFILPFVSIFLIFVINDARIIGAEYINRNVTNVMMGLVVWITIILGLNSLLNALSAIVKREISQQGTNFIIICSIALLITLIILIKVYQIRRISLKSIATKIE